MVDFTQAITKGVGLSSMLGSQEQFIKKATEQIEKARGEIGDKIDVRQSKLSELSSLQNLIRSIKSQATSLTSPLSSSFDNKKTVLSTADAGSVDDYLTGVQVDSSSLLGSVNVEVRSVATQSKLILADALNTGFMNAQQLNRVGNMVLTVAGQARTVPIIATDTIENIRDKTNQQFQANNDPFEAFLVDAGNGRAYLEIRAKQTGVNQAIVVAYNDGMGGGNLGGVGGDFVGQGGVNGYQAGTDATILVDGAVTLTQADNKFTNVVPGLSFTLAGRANTRNGDGVLVPFTYASSTITTTQDITVAKDSIVKFGNALNDLSYFIAKNSQSNGSPDKFANSAPTDLQNFDSEDSPLRTSAVLREAMQIWQTFTTSRNSAAGEIDSIYGLGMGVKSATRDGVQYQTVYFEDEGKFNKALNDAPDKVRRFFVTDADIAPNANVSSLKWIPGEFDRSVSSIANKNITIGATYDGVNAGQIAGVSATIGGVQYPAVLTPAGAGVYNAKFADNSPLNGMEFRVEAGAAALGALENFTVNIKPGMANMVTDQLRDMFGDSGLTGTTVSQGEFYSNEIDRLNKELARVEKELKAVTEKTNQEYQNVAQLDLMAGIQTAMIQAVLASLTQSSS